ncbi:MAG: ABC transporter ATP-binding protein [Acidilobaceae archaeon]|nr:ABC transporter ATP-binding protein [Acidilobaceae archaeon]MCX8165503.1 ABC transporter ATP-binding protein [Acidilobaceae archaeon]MDW7973930.1 ABC transporter ATP-binding protein [Sulfolobales archaeon]
MGELMGTVLEVSNVRKVYGTTVAVDNVTLKVHDGELVGLLGPNGAGKSTLIKISLGLLRRDKGTVILNGYDPYEDSRARRGVGVIFERPMLPDSLTIIDLLDRASRIYGTSREEVRRAVKYTGLEPHLYKTFTELSAGLKQRAAIAHALLSRPRLIVADEPTSNLDPIERGRLLELIDTLNSDEKISFIVSSHVIPEISRVAKRVVVMNRGRIILEGDVSEVVMKTSVARIRASDVKALEKILSLSGYDVRVEGINLIVKLKGVEQQAELLRLLADISASGTRILSMDFAGAGLEEVLRSG